MSENARLIDMARVKEEYVCTSISFRWWGQMRSTDAVTRRKMAESVDGEEGSYHAAKRLYLSSEESIQAVCAVRTRIKSYWFEKTIPYKDGVRLLKRDALDGFYVRLLGTRPDGSWSSDSGWSLLSELRDRAHDVQVLRERIMSDAMIRLGSGFDPRDYPANLSDLFGFSLTFPSLEPDGSLPPTVYAQQLQEVRQTVSAAVGAWRAEQMELLHEMMTHCAAQLTPSKEGQRRKVLRSAAVLRIGELLGRVGQLDPAPESTLTAFLDECRETLAARSLKELRSSEDMRRTFSGDCLSLARRLEGHLVSERVISTETREALRAARLAVQAERTLLGLTDDVPSGVVADALEEQGADAAGLVARLAALSEESPSPVASGQ